MADTEVGQNIDEDCKMDVWDTVCDRKSAKGNQAIGTTTKRNSLRVGAR